MIFFSVSAPLSSWSSSFFFLFIPLISPFSVFNYDFFALFFFFFFLVVSREGKKSFQVASRVPTCSRSPWEKKNLHPFEPFVL